MSLGTASGDAITIVALTGLLEEDLLVISVDIQIALEGVTPPEGPRRFGLAHGDYSVAEIAEALDVTLLTPDNKIEQERAGRLVRTIGKLPGANITEVMNDGKPVRPKLIWTIGNGEVLNLWHRNLFTGALTTGSNVEAEGKIYGRWLR